MPKPRVLVAGTRYAIDVLEGVLGGYFEVQGATSMADALARCAWAEVIICNVHFDDSRMFEFLHALRDTQAGRRLPVICCRVQPAPLSPNVRRAIEHALEALGIVVFVDRPLLLERYHASVVDEMLRQLVLDRVPR